MITPQVKAQIRRDARLAIAIHAVFLVVLAIPAIIPSLSFAFFFCSIVFLPQYLTFYAISAFDSPQPFMLLVLRCILGFLISFVFSLLYAAACHSVAFFTRLVISRLRARGARSV
jgi:hypothetical protein